MLRKAALLTAAWYVLAILLSGCCNCPPNPARKFRWTSMDLAAHQYSVEPGLVRIHVQDTAADFTRTNPAIEVRMSYELIASGRRGCARIIGQAYACKCDIEPGFRPERRIAGLKIYTLNAYDTAHPASSEVTDYFKSPRYTQDSGIVMGPMDLPGTSAEIGNAALNHFLFLDVRPAIGTGHQFKFVFTLEDGSALADTTSVLRF